MHDAHPGRPLQEREQPMQPCCMPHPPDICRIPHRFGLVRAMSAIRPSI